LLKVYKETGTRLTLSDSSVKVYLQYLWIITLRKTKLFYY